MQDEISFFKKIIISIKDFDKYEKFAIETLKKNIKYLLQIVLIFSILVCATYTYKFVSTLKQSISFLEENIQQLDYSNGRLSINNGEEIKIQNENSIINLLIINTSTTNKDQYLDLLQEYDNSVLVLQDKIVLKTKVLNQNMIYNYVDIAQTYKMDNFNKQDIVKQVENINIINISLAFFVTVTIYIFSIYFATALVDALVLGGLGFLLARIAKIKIKFKAAFNIGIHALTLPILLNLIYILVNTFTGFTIQYFQWMYTTISYIYVIVAILIIKTDLINRQFELMKIIEEQEKVKEEIKLQEEEQKDEEKNKNKEPEEENKTEDERDNNVGQEPGIQEV
ncbi:MAG: DUF1189 domain-containing protein [Clostridia bacterium]|jgi:hypothetical protein|nr:DUF1189 domain-containing protein [Clostridia bacterium]